MTKISIIEHDNLINIYDLPVGKYGIIRRGDDQVGEIVFCSLNYIDTSKIITRLNVAGTWMKRNTDSRNWFVEVLKEGTKIEIVV